MVKRLASAILFFLASVYGIAHAAGSSATLYSKQGTVEANRGGKGWSSVELGAQFSAGDEVRVDPAGKAALLFSDGVLMRLGPGAYLKLGSNDQNRDSGISLNSGKFHFFNRGGESIPPIDSPTVSAAVRGTEIVFDVSAQGTVVSVIDGQVECSNSSGSLAAGRGEQVVSAPGAALRKTLMVNPYDAVQWALNYPLVMTPAELRALEDASSAEERETGELLRRAAEKLTSGRQEEALALLTEAGAMAKKAGPNGNRLLAVVLSQQALVEVVRNRKDEAQKLADDALRADSAAPATLLAGAYVAQSALNLEKAEELLANLLQTHPENPIALARLAEIELGSGRIKEASAHIGKALSIEPSDAYTRSLSGFAALFRNENELAAREFAAAEKMDSAAALPHLGLALVRIKSGDLELGRTELEKAVLLEPTTAVYRSYLGKAFFEREEEDLAGNEYELALQLDPRDPTPYLYRAFNRLSQNDVIGALSDVETSITLNDNRAVYRSSLQLDRDLGVRTSSLAPIFNELGFSRTAEREAIKSIDLDYRNYSGHVFLAGSSDNFFSADLGTSERRIAKLLAPVSFNLMTDIGGEASLNDYTSLFDRRNARTNVSAGYQSRGDLYLLDAHNAGTTGNFGYLLGASSELGLGGREGGGLRDYRARLDLQYQPDYKDRLLLEAASLFRETDVEESELHDDVPFGLTLGYSRRIDADSQFISDVAVENRLKSTDEQNARALDIYVTSGNEEELVNDPAVFHEQSWNNLRQIKSEAQYILDKKHFSLIAGIDHHYVETDRDEDSLILSDENGWYTGAGYRVEDDSESFLQSGSGYLYGKLRLTALADLDLGGAYSRVEQEYTEIPPFVDGTFDRERFSPKAGLSFYPHRDWTLRTAYYETLQKSLLEDQASIEPTTLGGFSQRLRQGAGAAARNAGIGVDYKNDAVFFAGAEWVRRHLIAPRVFTTSAYEVNLDEETEEPAIIRSPVLDQHNDQDLARAYIHTVLSRRLAASADYLFARYEETDNDPAAEAMLNRLNRGALGLKYFDPSGFFASGQAVWRNQELENAFLTDGRSSFWTFNASGGYRLPRRHGSLTLQLLDLFDKRFQYDQSLGFEPVVPNGFTVRLVASVNF